MSNGAEQASGGATYRMLRELGSRAQHSFAAIREPGDLVVAQRFVRGNPTGGSGAGTALDAEATALLLRDARCLAKNWHPNIALVRYVDLAFGELTIATELLDGSTLADLFEAAKPERATPRDPILAFPMLVRIMLDVLAGLHALHGLRDGMNVPLGAIHGELCPANVVVGKDGIARIVNVLRKRPVRIERGSEAVGYAAPEALDGDGTEDPRSDIYAVGVMLWEGLAGLRLYEERDPGLVLSRQREGEVAPPVIHPSSPFARLSDVAMRALAFDPALRFQGTLEMAAELRKIAGNRLAAGSAVASLVSELVGERIRMRRALLDPALSGTRKRASGRGILAAENAVREREQRESREQRVQRELREELAALADKIEVRASPRRVSQTVRAEIPLALIAASKPSTPRGVADVLLDDREVLDGDALLEDDDDLPGPRGSSPELDLETTVHLAIAVSAARGFGAPLRVSRSASVPPAKGVSPMTPNVPFPASAVPPNPTPGDFVIPIDVTETMNDAPPARGFARLGVYALAAALVLLAMAAFVALRAVSDGRGAAPAAVASPPPPAMMEGAPPTDLTAPATTPIARPAAVPGKPVTTATAAPAARPAGSAIAKPKKSIYEPDGL